jgi:hypothetical protein
LLSHSRYRLKQLNQQQMRSRHLPDGAAFFVCA